MANITQQRLNNLLKARLEALLDDANRHEQTILTPIIVYIVILMVSGLVGNLVVLYVYTFRFRRSSSRTFILCLAILDTLTCLFGMPYHIIDMTHAYTFYNVVACKTLSYIMALSLLCSIYVLVLIAIDRYRKICKPFKKQISDIGTKTASALAVVLAAICSTPNIFLYGHATIELPGTHVRGVECFIADIYTETVWPMIYNVFLFIIFVGCTLILSVLYVLVGLKIWRQGSFQREDSNRRNSQWKFCGSTSPQTTQIALSESENPSLRVKAVRYHKTSDVDGIPENNDAANTQGEQFEMDISDDEDAVFRTKTTETSFVSNQSAMHQQRKNQRESKRIAFQAVRLHNMSTSDDEDAPCHSSTRRTGSLRSRMSSYRRSVSLSRKQRRSLKITCMLFLITLVFVISFLPHLVLLIFDAVDDSFWWNISDTQNIVYNLFLRTYFINNMANPIIYGFLDIRFRSEVCLLFKKIGKCKWDSIFGR
ncbi:cholecystokinin receptor type A-like [Mizuhopecten yessoensis]|uniref:cholecystokinin receptor type A-like n=1 Tax=Mizuhopecten yessoensis TaxID=6573 RepID=UPI000B458064|nr:cholecystokinin receptor type A-like [Mizuhopecten yessoensis]